MKRPWHSKTLFFNTAVFLYAVFLEFFPKYAESMGTHRLVKVLATFAVINKALRLKTKECIKVKKIVPIFLIFFLVACSSVQQKLEPDVFYKRDIGVEVNGQYFEGVTVVPFAKSYSINLIPPGNIDLMLIRTCHREYTVEKTGKGWGLFGGKKQKYTYDYVPIQGIEDVRVCPLRVEVYESDKGRHSWAMIDMENPKYSLKFSVDCNGESYRANGVAACQAKEQSIQRLGFSEPVMFAPASRDCHPAVKNGAFYEIKASVGECPYIFETQDGKLGRITVTGYQGVLVRSAQ